MTTALSDSERVSALADLVSDTPTVVVDMGVVRANVNRAAAIAAEAGVALRPHTKTHKLPADRAPPGRGGRRRAFRSRSSARPR